MSAAWTPAPGPPQRCGPSAPGPPLPGRVRRRAAQRDGQPVQVWPWPMAMAVALLPQRRGQPPGLRAGPGGRGPAAGAGTARWRGPRSWRRGLRWLRRLPCPGPAADWLNADAGALAEGLTALEQAQPAEADVPLLYGTTLGLVLMAPGWWGFHRSWRLGPGADRRGGPGGAAERGARSLGGGEATGSLCAGAGGRGIPQSADNRPRSRIAAFALVLSSDGIRKSCATDADFLALACHLGPAPRLWQPATIWPPASIRSAARAAATT